MGSGNKRKQVDGDKFVCLDPLLSKESCLVYSFGVANDWTFEDQMDDLGALRYFTCLVRPIMYMY